MIQAAENGFADVVRWWLMWRDIPLSETENLRVEINQDFLSTPIGAREIRAIQMLYSDGFIPLSVLYEYFKKAEIIPSAMTQEEFETELKREGAFLNAPDAQARQRGYADRTQELEQVRVAREADQEDEQIALTEREVVVEEDKLEISRKVGSTSVAASRKLGDPEQAAPSKLEQGQLKVQNKVADKPVPKPAAPARRPGGR